MANKKKSIKGTQTERNLVIAYLAESSAYTRYMFYAAQADKENYFPIGQISVKRLIMRCDMARCFSNSLKEAK